MLAKADIIILGLHHSLVNGNHVAPVFRGILIAEGVVTDFTFRDPVPVIQVVRSGSKRIAFLG